jgi:hypothetical protein
MIDFKTLRTIRTISGGQDSKTTFKERRPET